MCSGLKFLADPVKGLRWPPPEKLILKIGKRFEATAYGKLSVVLAFTLGVTIVAAWGALSEVLLFMR